jgi:hypothetical protein
MANNSANFGYFFGEGQLLLVEVDAQLHDSVRQLGHLGVAEVLRIDQLLADLREAPVEEELDGFLVQQGLLDGQSSEALEQLHPFDQDRQGLGLSRIVRHVRGGHAFVPRLFV